MENDLIRYSCQMALPGFGKDAQKALSKAKVLVVGVGGLGCPSAQYLAAAGIGTLGIADFDTISIGNLHRQILYTPEDAGKKKVLVACQKLQQQNPGIRLVPHDVRISSDNIMDIVQQYDIIIDGTDNFDTRYLINDACVITGKPLVYGAIYQFEGQVSVWNVGNTDGTQSPNYRDLFPEVDATQVPNCADGGVIPTIAAIIGCIQANEAIKYITKTGDLLTGKVMIFDTQTMQSRLIKIGRVTQTQIASLQQTADIATMSVSAVKKRLIDGSLELVDIRTDQERDEIDIGGIHFEADEIEENMEYLLSPTVKVLYCSSGKRSGEAVKQIRKKYPQAKVYSLDGGLQAWFGR